MKPKQYLSLRNSLVELLGTTIIVFFANLSKLISIVGPDESDPLRKYWVPETGTYGLVYGLVTSLMVYAGSLTSGGIYDPAVTVLQFSYLLD